jgi:MFS family permease
MPGYKSFLKLTTATQSLNVSSTFIGWGIASFTMGPVINRIGRKNGVAMSIVLKLTGVTLMTAAQNVGMFVAGRVMMGLGTGTSAMSAST